MRRKPVERILAEDYVVVFQLTRGQGESEGTFHFFFDDVNDGFDAIQWIAEQDWCNGNVGMAGASYGGNVQLLAARTKPPALKCIMPTAFVGSFTRYFPFAHGVPHRGYFMQWHQVVDAESWGDTDCVYGDMIALKHPKWGPALNHRPLVDAANTVLSGDKLASWRETISHPMDDDYWAPIHFTDKELAELDIPMFITDGWYDMTFGPIDYFTRLEKVQPDRNDRYLLVGPWNHYQAASGLNKPGDNDGDRILPDNGVIDQFALRMAFFDRYLKQDQSATIQEDRVKIYITGRKNPMLIVGSISTPFPSQAQNTNSCIYTVKVMLERFLVTAHYLGINPVMNPVITTLMIPQYQSTTLLPRAMKIGATQKYALMF